MKRWIKELELNINGFRKMAKGYREEGGFKEVKEILEKYNLDLGIPDDLLKEGRELELQHAEICLKLADKYEQLLQYIKKKANVE